jgi:hypothetical protein
VLALAPKAVAHDSVRVQHLGLDAHPAAAGSPAGAAQCDRPTGQARSYPLLGHRLMLLHQFND